MGFWAGTYGLIFCHDFLNSFWKDRKIDYFHKNIYFLSIDAQKQKLCQNKLKTKDMATQKKNSKFKLEFLLILFLDRLYFFLHRNLLFIPFEFVMRKL